MQETLETWVQSLGQEDPPEEEMATILVFLTNPTDRRAWGQKKVRHALATKHNNSLC